MLTIDLSKFQWEIHKAEQNAAAPREATIKRLVELLARLLPNLSQAQKQLALPEALSALRWLDDRDSERLMKELLQANADAKEPSASPAQEVVMGQPWTPAYFSALRAEESSTPEPTAADPAPSTLTPWSGAEAVVGESGGTGSPSPPEIPPWTMEDRPF